MLYFLHIPKTAGTTLTSILDRRFAAADICPTKMWHKLLKIPRSELASYRLIRGHFYHYVHQVLPQEPVTVTFLRDPVERALSHYAHIVRDPIHYFHQKVQAQGGLREFLRDPETLPMVAEFQTRAIGLDLNPMEIATTLSTQDLESLRLEQMMESVMPLADERDSLLQRARQRLDRFAFVGLTERFEESVELLAWTLGWDDVPDHEQLNVAPNRAKANELPDDVLRTLRNHLHLDFELYSYGRRLFETRLAEMRLATSSAGGPKSHLRHSSRRWSMPTWPG